MAEEQQPAVNASIQKRICVVIDSTELFNDYKLQKASLRRLLNIVKLCGVLVYVPRVVFDELVHQREERLAEAIRTLKKSLRDFRHVSMVDVPFEFPDLSEPYGSFLENLMAQKEITVIGYPHISHAEIVNRFLEYRKPLGKRSGKKKDDAGYKDALLWETILELLDTSCEEVLFISANYTDFAESDSGPIHKDLAEDLVERGHSENIVNYTKSLERGADYLCDRYKLTVTPVSKLVVAEILAKVNFDELLTEHVQDIEECMNVSSEDILLGDSANEAFLYWNVEGSEVTVTNTELLENGEVVIDANAEFENEVAYHMFLSSYCGEDDRLEEAGISLYDSDAEADLAHVGGNMLLSLNFSFVYNPLNHDTSGFEAIDIRRID